MVVAVVDAALEEEEAAVGSSVLWSGARATGPPSFQAGTSGAAARAPAAPELGVGGGLTVVGRCAMSKRKVRFAGALACTYIRKE